MSFLKKSFTQKDTNVQGSTINFDVKPLIKIALSKNKAKAFCAKTNTLAKLRNSRYKYVKTKLKEEIGSVGIIDFINELLVSRTYLHPAVKKVIGKYIKNTIDIGPELRRKVY